MNNNKKNNKNSRPQLQRQNAFKNPKNANVHNNNNTVRGSMYKNSPPQLRRQLAFKKRNNANVHINNTVQGSMHNKEHQNAARKAARNMTATPRIKQRYRITRRGIVRQKKPRSS